MILMSSIQHTMFYIDYSVKTSGDIFPNKQQTSISSVYFYI